MMLTTTLDITNQQSVAIIGGGGKTTLMLKLAREYKAIGKKVLATTSTHIFTPEDDDEFCYITPTSLAEVDYTKDNRIPIAGYSVTRTKSKGLGEDYFHASEEVYDTIVYEADGARRLPIKLHADYEPVIWSHTGCCIIVLGLSALGQPAQDICHRFHLSPKFVENPCHPIDYQDFEDIIMEHIACTHMEKQDIRIILNQADTVAEKTQLNGLVSTIEGRGYHIIATSLLTQLD